MAKDKDKQAPGDMSATPAELTAQDVADNDTASDDTSEDSASFFARMTR